MSVAIAIFQGQFGRVALLDMDRPLVPHAHSQCHVLFKASGADSTFCVRGRPFPVTEDTAILVNAGEPHSYGHRASAPRTLYLALYIEPQWLADIYDPLLLSATRDFFLTPCVRISQHIRRLADGLIAELTAAYVVSRTRLENLLFDLMLAIVEPFSRLRDPSRASQRSRLSVSDARIFRAVNYLKDNVRNPPVMDQLAREAYLSRAHFFLRFQRCTGLTPQVFTNMLRMEDICRHLARSQDRATIGRLASELGFADQANFTRFVRSHAGVVPGEYRRVVQLYA